MASVPVSALAPDVRFVPSGGVLPEGDWRLQPVTGAWPVRYRAGDDSSAGPSSFLEVWPGIISLPRGAKLAENQCPVYASAPAVWAPWARVGIPNVQSLGAGAEYYLKADLSAWDTIESAGLFVPTAGFEFHIRGNTIAESAVGLRVYSGAFDASFGYLGDGIMATTAAPHTLESPAVEIVVTGGKALQFLDGALSSQLVITVPGPFRLAVVGLDGDYTSEFPIRIHGVSGPQSIWR